MASRFSAVSMPRAALVQGVTGGIGLALARNLAASAPAGSRVYAACRKPSPELQALAAERPDTIAVLEGVDLADESSIAAAAAHVGQQDGLPLQLVISASGLLHNGGPGLEGMLPEKKLSDLDPAAIAQSFAINTIGPMMMAKHFAPLLAASAKENKKAAKDSGASGASGTGALTPPPPPIFASLSARVGSISDNRLGGWYAYRASKAAQHQFTRTLSIEMKRKGVLCVALHPGTVDTGLSKPFQRNVPEGKVGCCRRGRGRGRGRGHCCVVASKSFLCGNSSPIYYMVAHHRRLSFARFLYFFCSS